jgi:hypothetical protein
MTYYEKEEIIFENLDLTTLLNELKKSTLNISPYLNFGLSKTDYKKYINNFNDLQNKKIYAFKKDFIFDSSYKQFIID